jgi:pilus assembly protein CpaE
MLKVAFDTVIIDCSKSLHESDFIAFQMADLILMVAQLDLNCLRNSARLLKLFRDQGDLSEKVRVVVNRSGSHFNEIGVKKAEEVLRCELLFQLPNDSRTCSEAMKRGQPIEVVAPRSPICKGLLEIAASLRMPTRDGAANENTITAGVSRRGRFAALF